MNLKIDVVSDLHVDAWFNTTRLHDPKIRMWEGEPFVSEFLHIDWNYYKNPESQVLVIAGDTSNSIPQAVQVAQCASRVYDHVVVVDGNHEHYSGESTVSVGMSEFRSTLSEYSNITYLEGHNHTVFEGVMFVGATGWYDWQAFEDRLIFKTVARQAWSNYSRDSVNPNFAEAGDPERLAILQSTQMAEVVRCGTEDDSVKAIVAVTHMSPRADLMQWREDNHTWNLLTPSYVNTHLANVLAADTGKKIKCWVYGHTHYRRTDVIDGVTYVNNARGYPDENPPLALVQVEIPNQ